MPCATLNWWIDQAGVFHAQPEPPKLECIVIARGVVDPDHHTGTITHFQGRRATLSLVPHEIFDVLDRRYPKARWWIADAPTPSTTPLG